MCLRVTTYKPKLRWKNGYATVYKVFRKGYRILYGRYTGFKYKPGINKEKGKLPQLSTVVSRDYFHACLTLKEAKNMQNILLVVM